MRAVTLATLVLELLDWIQALEDLGGRVRPGNIADTHCNAPMAMTFEAKPGSVTRLTPPYPLDIAATTIHAALRISDLTALRSLLFVEGSIPNQWGAKFVATVSGIDLTRLRSGNLHDREWPRLTVAIEMLRHKNIYVIEGSQSLHSIDRTARSYLERRGRAGSVVVAADCLNEWRAESQHQLFPKVVAWDSINALASEFNCPFIVVWPRARSIWNS